MLRYPSLHNQICLVIASVKSLRKCLDICASGVIDSADSSNICWGGRRKKIILRSPQADESNLHWSFFATVKFICFANLQKRLQLKKKKSIISFRMFADLGFFCCDFFFEVRMVTAVGNHVDFRWMWSRKCC